MLCIFTVTLRGHPGVPDTVSEPLSVTMGKGVFMFMATEDTNV